MQLVLFRDLFVIIYGLIVHFMGGVEDDEPPSKRVKASFRESKGHSNGSFLKEPASCSLMARPLASQRDDEIVGSQGIKKVEFVRIIADALYSLGYSKTGACLEEESGITFQSPTVSTFIQQILDGDWDGSLASLHKMGIVDESIIKSASFIILQQKFFDLLDHEKLMEALKTLRTEISPLSINSNRVRELSFFMLSPKSRITDGISGQQMVKPKARSELLEELRRMFPPTVMIPDRRLLQLVEQALDLQREACLFHNSDVGETSLFTDHHCGRDQIPSQTVQILQEHQDEVWYLQFSQNGKYLASSSSDNSAIIWEVDLDEEGVRRWDVSSGECLHVYEKGLLGLISCSWSPDGKCVFSGACFGGLEQGFIASGSEDSQVYIWHRGSGELIETLEGHSGAVNCISWNPMNPHMLASASDDRSIRIWGLKELSPKHKGKGKLAFNNGNHYCNGATI
ncbi:hypothetical protein L1987_77003 [Smallanthus sonchifolius]|uniref:Uncharacterized protein n=1 Tax=Smallanthus sonchifolius TaxID=185202 RepID=A0ACB8ZD61_9ASTR|nr:hypothetical protein L1987_77003 [Smallanthus sonchifolius]